MFSSKKIYYTAQGWVCNRYPYNLPIEDESRFIEVDEETFNKTLVCKVNFSWRIVNGKLVQERYQADSEEEAKQAKKVSLKAELEKIKEDIEQENFGIVRDDFAKKKARAAEIINELRALEGKEPREVL